jgi:hypothetical protein
MGLHIKWTKVPINAQINMKTIQKIVWKTKQFFFSTQL